MSKVSKKNRPASTRLPKDRLEAAILHSYAELVSTATHELRSLSASVLDEIVNNQVSTEDESLRSVLKQALTASFRNNKPAAAAAAQQARLALSSTAPVQATPSADPILVTELAREIQRIAQVKPLAPRNYVDLEKTGVLPLQKAMGLELNSKLRIVNHLAHCIDDTESGDDVFSVGLVVVDPVGGVQQYGPWGMGTFNSGTKKTNSWLFAEINLGIPREAPWPRTYSVVWTLAEKDGGGFADYVAKLLAKLRDYLSKELAKKITASLMGLVGAVVAAKIGAAIGASAGSVVPVVGTIVGAIIGALVGWGIGQLIGAINSWIKDDIFAPAATQLQLNYPGETWGGATKSDPWWVEWNSSKHGRFRLEYTWNLDWGFNNLGASRPQPLVKDDGKTQQLVYRAGDGSVAALYSTIPMPKWAWASIGNSAGAPAALSDPYAYFNPVNKVQYGLYLGSDLHLHALWQSGDSVWHHDSPSLKAKAMLGAGRPWAYFNQGTHHLTYRGLDSQIYVLWDNGTWVGRSPSMDAGAPLAAGDPCALMSDKLQSLYYRGQDGHIYELWAGEKWQCINVTGSAGAPRAMGNPHAYLRAGALTHHVAYWGEDGHIWVCWWDQAQDRYLACSPSQLANAPAAAGDPYGIVLSDGKISIGAPSANTSTQNIVYRGIDGLIYQLWAGNTWSVTNIAHGLSLPKSIGNPTAYIYGKMGNGQPMLNIAYLGDNANYYTLWFHGSGWGWANVSAQAGAALPGA